MKPMSKNALRWEIAVLVGFVALIALFYAGENWSGKRAWENCKRELEAKGVVLGSNAYISPPVPDEQNFFKASKMQEWFVKKQYPETSELADRLHDKKFEALAVSVSTPTNLNKTAAAAKDYLEWSDQFKPEFDLIRAALKRPYARMDGDYSDPFEMPTPDFTAERAVAQTTAQRAHCYLLLGQPEKALGELTLLNDSRRLLEAAPTGRPMTLVAAVVNVAVTRLYVNTLADGLQSHAWLEPQLVTLQDQLKKINLVTNCTN
jgi:hypothetical protein